MACFLDDRPSIASRVEPLLRDYRVQIVLTGHCQNYERTYPMFRFDSHTQSYPMTVSIMMAAVIVQCQKHRTANM